MQNQTVNRCEITLEYINGYNAAFSNLGSFYYHHCLIDTNKYLIQVLTFL